MIVLVILLAVTNLVTLAVLLRDRWRTPAVEEPAEPGLRAALDGTTPPVGVPNGTRRLISIEILNPIELAGTRGRVLGVAGSLAPGLTRRIVYDQVAKILRRQLGERSVVADVRVHTLEPVRPPTPTGVGARVEVDGYVDQVEIVVDEPDDQPPV